MSGNQRSILANKKRVVKDTCVLNAVKLRRRGLAESTAQETQHPLKHRQAEESRGGLQSKDDPGEVSLTL